jgi:hypothetical protein
MPEFVTQSSPVFPWPEYVMQREGWPAYVAVENETL